MAYIHNNNRSNAYLDMEWAKKAVGGRKKRTTENEIKTYYRKLYKSIVWFHFWLGWFCLVVVVLFSLKLKSKLRLKLFEMFFFPSSSFIIPGNVMISLLLFSLFFGCFYFFSFWCRFAYILQSLDEIHLVYLSHVAFTSLIFFLS